MRVAGYLSQAWESSHESSSVTLLSMARKYSVTSWKKNSIFSARSRFLRPASQGEFPMRFCERLRCFYVDLRWRSRYLSRNRSEIVWRQPYAVTKGKFPFHIRLSPLNSLFYSCTRQRRRITTYTGIDHSRNVIRYFQGISLFLSKSPRSQNS